MNKVLLSLSVFLSAFAAMAAQSGVNYDFDGDKTLSQFITTTPESDVTINVSAPGTLTVDAALDLSSLHLNFVRDSSVSGEVSVALAGTAGITVSNLDVGEGVVIRLANGTTLSGSTATNLKVNSKVTGSGVIAWTAVLPDTGLGWTESGWDGVVWIRNLAFTDLVPTDYVNADSPTSGIRFSGSAGYCAKQQFTIPVLELEGDGYSNALTINNGYSYEPGNEWAYFAAKKLRGSGKLVCSASAGWVVVAVKEDWSEFSGALQLENKSLWLGEVPSVQDIDIVKSGTLHIADGCEFTFREGVAYSLAGGLDGTGTLKLLNPSQANIQPFATSSSWEGIVELAAHEATSATPIYLDCMGNANSAVVLNSLTSNGGSHYINKSSGAGNYNTNDTTVILNGDVVLDNGYSYEQRYVTRLMGTGNLTTTHYTQFHIAEVARYTGTLASVNGIFVDSVDLTGQPAIGTKVLSVTSDDTRRKVTLSKISVNGAATQINPVFDGSGASGPGFYVRKVAEAGNGVYSSVSEAVSETMDGGTVTVTADSTEYMALDKSIALNIANGVKFTASSLSGTGALSLTGSGVFRCPAGTRLASVGSGVTVEAFGEDSLDTVLFTVSGDASGVSSVQAVGVAPSATGTAVSRRVSVVGTSSGTVVRQGRRYYWAGGSEGSWFVGANWRYEDGSEAGEYPQNSGTKYDGDYCIVTNKAVVALDTAQAVVDRVTVDADVTFIGNGYNNTGVPSLCFDVMDGDGVVTWSNSLVRLISSNNRPFAIYNDCNIPEGAYAYFYAGTNNGNLIAGDLFGSGTMKVRNQNDDDNGRAGFTGTNSGFTGNLIIPAASDTTYPLAGAMTLTLTGSASVTNAVIDATGLTGSATIELANTLLTFGTEDGRDVKVLMPSGAMWSWRAASKAGVYRILDYQPFTIHIR